MRHARPVIRHPRARRANVVLTAFGLAAATGLIGALPAISADDTPATTTITVGAGPNAVAIAPDQSVWTANFGSDSITPVVDGVPGPAIPVGAGPFDVAADPARDLLYVTNYYDGTLSVVDRGARTVSATVQVGNFPTGVEVSPDGSRIYVANLGTGSLSILDADNIAGDQAVVDVGTDSQPWGLAAAPDGSYIAISHSNGLGGPALGWVSLLDTATLTDGPAIPVGQTPTGIVVSNDGRTVYVANTDGDSVSAIDVASASVVGRTQFPTGSAPMGVALAANEHALYVTGLQTSQVYLADPDTYDLLSRTIVVGLAPRGIAVGDDGKSAYVANSGANSLTRITWTEQPREPGAPTDAKAMAGELSATVSWQAPADPGTSPITSYTVRATTGDGTCSVPAGQALTCTVTGLPAGIPRTFTVTATSAVGTSDPSTPSNTVVPTPAPGPGPGPTPLPPAAPTSVSAVAGIESAEVTWTAPTDSGSSAISRYIVTGSPGGDTCSTPADSTTCLVDDLNPDIPVTFTVVAVNASGTSVPSKPSAPVTPFAHPGAPSAPRDLQVALGERTITATWSAPDNDGHSPITGYEAVAHSTTGDDWRTCSTDGARTCVITGLTAGSTYRVFVTAENDQGTSPPSPYSEPIYVTEAATIAHVSSTVALQSYQQVLRDSGAPTATITSTTQQACVVDSGRVLFIAKGMCKLVVKQPDFPTQRITTSVSGSKPGTATRLTTAAQVSFSKGSAKLSKAAKSTLNGAIASLKRAGDVTVVGYASTSSLARQRAKAIANYLTNKRVSIAATSTDVRSKSPDKGVVRTAPTSRSGATR